VVKDSLEDLYRDFSDHLAGLIIERNAMKKPTRVILPVGPVDQYPLFAERVRQDKIDLSGAFFFFMDEYADALGNAFPVEHPLSLKSVFKRLFLDRVEKKPPPENIIFPDEKNITALAGLISEAQIEVCYGGIGVHGHVAFNEPEPGVENTGPRRVRVNDYTVTINAMRAGVGGDLENFPRQAFTIGMTQILSAKTIRLYSRSIPPFDWAKTTLRLALFGEPGWDYPVTFIRESDYTIVTDRATAQPPEILL
jgi:glucosamine-6-phosphate deaminase